MLAWDDADDTEQAADQKHMMTNERNWLEIPLHASFFLFCSTTNMTNSWRRCRSLALLITLWCEFQGRGGVYLVAGFAAADSSPTSITTSSSAAKPALPAALLAQIRTAMELTTGESTHNITAAREAVSFWDSILGEIDTADSGVKAPLPPAILAASLGLHASALTRIGDDKRAERVYARALLPEMQPYLNLDSFRDICFGRAYALQRLMRYEEAVDQLLTYLNEDNLTGQRDGIGQAVNAAATCALRAEDWDKAIDIDRKSVV